MACESMRRPGVTIEQRKVQVKTALARLEAALAAGTVKVTVNPSGAMAFNNWSAADRDGVSDVCAYRALLAANSSALRMAVARGEALANRKISAVAVGAGIHSHDGGKTWHSGH